ncbi:MAG TPA: bifunctional pyr operon transcriptional regulator/uracil phosphoribosyltransferase PyrR [Gammaproteobacteria bacterium]|nr:bifunctional pyr operon transcriptional regulator/uracil phosphoribosyltransferase PyrR [Gammaproteobacteria bacterium]
MGTPNEVEQLLEEIARELKDLVKQQDIKNPVMIGIHTGGVWVAEKLHRLLGLDSELGTMDISFYRDDFTRIGINPQVQPTSLPFSIDDQHIILVDDVLHTGRTIRAAMNELFDYGRPASISLVTLVERSGRELPIAASIVGKQLDLEPGQHVKLTGPDPLQLVIQKTPD